MKKKIMPDKNPAAFKRSYPSIITLTYPTLVPQGQNERPRPGDQKSSETLEKQEHAVSKNGRP